MTPHRKPISLYIKSEKKSSIICSFWQVFFTFFYIYSLRRSVYKTGDFCSGYLQVLRHLFRCGKPANNRPFASRFPLPGAAGHPAGSHTGSLLPDPSDIRKFLSPPLYTRRGYMSRYFCKFCVILSGYYRHLMQNTFLKTFPKKDPTNRKSVSFH